MGPIRFIIFYLVCGAIAALAQVYANPTSPVAMLGASGAVAGVLGAYLVRFPTARVQTCLFVFFFITIVRLPAIVLLGLWFLLQFASGMSDMRNGDDGGGVAWWAHIGGFLAGMLLVYLFAKPQRARYNSWE
jgi:membrane associated rhomboid family serine protease